MSTDEAACIDGPDGCARRVAQCWPGYGQRTWPRCERHDRERRERERREREHVAEAPSILAPRDFDPADAGEHWDAE